MDVNLIYGPEDNTILYGQSEHRSEDVYNGNIDTTLNVRNGKTNFLSKTKSSLRLHLRVVECLHDMGFGGIYRCGDMDVDHYLVTALVERWRPETHTFHLPVGETTVTLEDVAVLWGLPIRGSPIIRSDPANQTNEWWREECNRMLGFIPSPISGSTIKIKCLKDHLRNNGIEDFHSDLDVLKYARCAALLIISRIMWPDNSGDSLSLFYLYHMGWERDAEHVKEAIADTRSYSWGSATLAQLYRALCNAARLGTQQIGGPVQLLQVWAWTRIIPIRPECKRSRIDVGTIVLPTGRVLPVAPHAARWIKYSSWTKSASHNVRIFREIFDRLHADQFIWQPYEYESEEVVTLPDYCSLDICCANVPLINYAIVEMHFPDRVLRQFGYRQGIPANIDGQVMVTLHHETRRGNKSRDWVDFHWDYVEHWDDIADWVVVGDAGGGVTDDYWAWYRRITRKLITPYHHPTVGAEGYRPPDVALVPEMNQKLECLFQKAMRINNFNDPTAFQNLVQDIVALHQESLRIFDRSLGNSGDTGHPH